MLGEKYVVKGVTLFAERDSVALMQTFVCALLAKEKLKIGQCVLCVSIRARFIP